MTVSGDGTFYFEDGTKFGPDLTLQRALEEKFGEIDDMGNGYQWMTKRDIPVDLDTLNISLCFSHTHLTNAILLIAQKKSKGWEDLDYSDLNNSERIHEKWISRYLGNQRNFSWGTIGVEIDAKGGLSSIIVRYSSKK